jgi:uncharacterized protein YciI
MNKKYFVIKLLPSRQDFALTMTEEEKAIMQQHVEYWKPYMAEGVMLVFGPVMDPNGVYGLGVIAVDDEAQVSALLQNDPASKINRYEWYPMMALVPENRV